MDFFVMILMPQILHGLVWGMAIALIAIGLTIIFGLMNIVNFAHGELYMLGAFAGFFFAGIFGSFWVAFIISFLLVALIGVIIERVTLKPLYGRDPLYALLLTFGLSMVLQESARLIWGGVTYRLAPPISGSLNFYPHLSLSRMSLKPGSHSGSSASFLSSTSPAFDRERMCASGVP